MQMIVIIKKPSNPFLSRFIKKKLKTILFNNHRNLRNQKRTMAYGHQRPSKSSKEQ